MTSATCFRQSPSSIQVVDSHAIDDMLTDSLVSDHHRPNSSEGRVEPTSLPKYAWAPTSDHKVVQSRLKRPQSTPNPSRRTSHSKDDDNDSRKFQEWLSTKSIGFLQEKADTEVKKTKKMYESVLHTEDTFVKGLEGLVKHKDMLDLRKKEILHKNWSDQVHTPIRRQINDQMNGPGYPELQRRKRELHKEYLEHVNKKGHVFLDTIAPDEYYALSLHPTRPSLLVAETKSLRDPLISQQRERNSEDRMIYRCENGSVLSDRALAQLRLPPLPLVPLGRHGTECSTWLAMPMGDIESPVRFASRRRMQPDVNDAHFDFDHWGKAADQSVVDDEMRIQKRRSFTQGYRSIVPDTPLKQDIPVQCEA